MAAPMSDRNWGTQSKGEVVSQLLPVNSEVKGQAHLEALQELAAKRDDDILYVGSVNPTDVPSAMMSINEAVQWYSGIYGDVVGIAGQADEDDADEEDSRLGVADVLYGLMSETDKVGELTKLVGRLKFAVDGADAAQIDDDLFLDQIARADGDQVGQEPAQKC